MGTPEYLTDLARQVWEDTSKAFPKLAEEDPDLLTSYAQICALVKEMQETINRDGLVQPNSKGNPSSHPLLNTMKGYIKEKIHLSNLIRKRFQLAKDQGDSFA